jgi:hypothetical protein
METSLAVAAFVFGAILCIVSTQLFTAFQIRMACASNYDRHIHLVYGFISAGLGLVLISLSLYRLH